MVDPHGDIRSEGQDTERPSELAPVPPAEGVTTAPPGAPTTAPNVTEAPTATGADAGAWTKPGASWAPYAGGNPAPDGQEAPAPPRMPDVRSGTEGIAPGSWDEDEARKRLNLDRNNPQPGDQERLDHDRLVSTTVAALEDLGNLAFHRLVQLYANHRTRFLVSDEARKLDLDPDGVHAVLATLPGPDRSEWG